MSLNLDKVQEKSGAQFANYCYHVTERGIATQYIKSGGMKSAHLRGETEMTAGSFADIKKKEEGNHWKRELSKYLFLVVKKFHTKNNK